MPRTGHKIENFAEQLGTLLGNAENRARTWLGQRQQITKTLTSIRDTASSLLADLGAEAERAVRRGRKTMNAARALSAAPRRRRSKLSAAGRAAIVAAQRKRWAKVRKEKAAAR
ncbi:MAG TPA: hypothetical protein VEU08_14550 [Vicinamibacterales bacterium]|nr:hypothetical protein [Vicinamibacterales bacterium]